MSKKQVTNVVSEFLEFVNGSPSAFHAVAQAKRLLSTAGFSPLNEKDDDWKLAPGGKYYFTRNQSTIFAFAIGGAHKPGDGFSIVGAHTDSPCLKVKPISKKERAGYLQVGVEVYGGGLWHTWFDRDLSVAGRAIVEEKDEGGNSAFQSRLVRIDKPILRIPMLAIHLDRSVNESGFNPNKENHLLPVLATSVTNALRTTSAGSEGKQAEGPHPPLLLESLATELKVEPRQIRDIELSLYDTQPATVGGALDEFIFSARLDNLCMSYCALRSLLDSVAQPGSLAADKNVRIVALFDNEEIGSESDRGAGSNMMEVVMKRIHGAERFEAAVRKSFLISADMAHAVHPNYSEKHEENHRPALHKGLVVKNNANQRYATTSMTGFVMKELASRHNIPVQDFVVRNDSLCGSTIGPMLSASCGMRTVDVGVPQLSMHSIREMCGTRDLEHAVSLFTHFFNDFAALDATIAMDEDAPSVLGKRTASGVNNGGEKRPRVA